MPLKPFTPVRRFLNSVMSAFGYVPRDAQPVEAPVEETPVQASFVELMDQIPRVHVEDAQRLYDALTRTAVSTQHAIRDLFPYAIRSATVLSLHLRRDFLTEMGAIDPTIGVGGADEIKVWARLPISGPERAHAIAALHRHLEAGSLRVIDDHWSDIRREKAARGVQDSFPTADGFINRMMWVAPPVLCAIAHADGSLVQIHEPSKYADRAASFAEFLAGCIAFKSNGGDVNVQDPTVDLFRTHGVGVHIRCSGVDAGEALRFIRYVTDHQKVAELLQFEADLTEGGSYRVPVYTRNVIWNRAVAHVAKDAIEALPTKMREYLFTGYSSNVPSFD